MQIHRTSLTTVSPRAGEELQLRQSVEFYNGPRELRRPLGIYNLSLVSIWESFTEVLDELDHVLDVQTFRQDPPVPWDITLIRRHENLNSDMMRHFDDCLNVLACFFPKIHANWKQDAKYVKQQPPVKAAFLAAQPYRDHVALIMNHLKHQQGRLRGVVAFSESCAIPGYFVEHIDQNEVLEPHPDIHALYKGQYTAFSFFRDLRYLFWIVFAVSEYLADAIVALKAPTPNIIDAAGDAQIVTIARRLAALPNRTFADEGHMDFPFIGVETIDGTTELVLEYPSQHTILPALSGKYKVAIAWIGDGVTRSIKLPYFNP